MTMLQSVYMFGLPSGGSGPVVVQTDSNGVLAVSPATSNGNSAAVTQGNNDSKPQTNFGQTAISYNYDFNPATTFWERVHSGSNAADAIATTTTGNQSGNAFNLGWNGASFDRIRIPVIFKSVTATASGATAVWTPAAGKKFRLMGYTISVAGTLAATGVQALKLLDSAATITQHNANMIQTTTANISGGDTQIGVSLGQGFLSAAANNVLNINLGTAMATGSVAVNAWGTEE